jgi:hypothetical protein
VLKRQWSGDGSLFVCVCDDYLSDCEVIFKSQVVEHVEGFLLCLRGFQVEKVSYLI